mmetsp:Transcript_2793/g.6691  ORF Transcript_2793/g.6691 Transcript_2793/m.6691 type:complete len:208 (-) Transcript_2793:801-1424(-)
MRVPKRPPQIMPRKPPPMCTAAASKGSSIFIFWMAMASQNSKMPPANPITQQAQGSETATPEQTATRPARMPLHSGGRSTCLYLRKHIRMAASPPPEAARVVPTATFSARSTKPPERARVEPGLNPYQPNQRIRVPRPTKAELWGCMVCILPSASKRPILGPRMAAATKAMHPPTMCTTELPAKSTTPGLTQAPTATSGSLKALSQP